MKDYKLPTLAFLPWDSEIASSYLVKAIYRKLSNEDLNLVPVDPFAVKEMYNSIAKGYFDGTVSAWASHQPYYEKYLAGLEETVIMNDARIGLVVPKYVTINSITELNQYKDKFDSKIVAIEPRAGVTQKTYEAVEKYRLDFLVETGDSQSMLTALENAQARKQWIIVTGWMPHWKFAQWELKFLQDDLGVYGKTEEIKALIRKDLQESNRDLYYILKQFKLNSTLNAQLAMEIKRSHDPGLAAEKFLEQHPELLENIKKS